MQSAMEREISRLISHLRYGLLDHDRAVLASFFLCLAPFPPANFLGCLLVAFNFTLVASGKLTRRELPMLFAAATALAIYGILWSLIVHFALRSDWSIFRIPEMFGMRILNFLHLNSTPGQPFQSI
jgi:hypothetical protein